MPRSAACSSRPASATRWISLRRRRLPQSRHAGEPPSAAPRRIDGFLRHSNGDTTLWLDGVPGPLPAGLRAAPFPALELIPVHAPRQRLRTGDSWQAVPDTSPGRPE